ncbi:N,N-dimethylformamidase beta subunit family domain-containing protein [Streptomyces sp. NPDC006798]|uniref:N,N-dimethylformamidase beta subunit family domain-containing protein n=1 Tax=Streptomyces sp. NPDC006798 TaxID=3155462 RepID=UPI0033C0678E
MRDTGAEGPERSEGPGTTGESTGETTGGAHAFRYGSRDDDTGWAVPWYADPDRGPAGRAPRAPAGPRRRIGGFVSNGPVAPGGTLDFHITVDPPRPFQADVYRIGHYAGRGADKIASGPRLPGLVQPPPLAAGRTVSCHHWWLSWRLRVPSSWSPGAHIAVLTTVDGHRAHIPFTVRDDRPADLLLLLPDLTWQARNAYAGDGDRDPYPAPAAATSPPTTAAASAKGARPGPPGPIGPPPGEPGADEITTVSFDRPYAGSGLPPLAGHSYDVIRWAERYGYDLAYADGRDLHAGRVDPGRYRGLLFPGPDAYWSVPMRRAAEAARDAGTSLVFLSAGTLSRQSELAASASGAPDRLLTWRGRRGPGRPALWRDTDRAEQLLLGIQYEGRVPEPRPLVVRNADHWLWEATGAGEGDELPGLVAGEADRYFPRTSLPEHRGRILLAHSPYTDPAGVRRHQETSLYRAPSGALVFASGTSAWSPALDRPGRVDARVQRATANLLDRICKRD